LQDPLPVQAESTGPYCKLLSNRFISVRLRWRKWKQYKGSVMREELIRLVIRLDTRPAGRDDKEDRAAK
jgi:hypothetical protein